MKSLNTLAEEAYYQMKHATVQENINVIATALREERERTVKEIREICREYDVENGDYPEHKFEGIAVMEFIERKLKEDKNG